MLEYWLLRSGKMYWNGSSLILLLDYYKGMIVIQEFHLISFWLKTRDRQMILHVNS